MKQILITLTNSDFISKCTNYKYIYIYILYSYTTATSALPDINARA